MPAGSTNHASHAGIKNLIWLYFWLVIFEGALRKWFLPGLATPLLVVRDPIVLAAIALAFMQGVFRWNAWLSAASIIAVASLMLAFAVGHGNLILAAFGFRANFLHIPMIFLIGSVFDRRDVEKMVYATIAVGVGMVFVLALQFRSGPTAWVNTGVGGVGTSTFDAVGEYRRPSGVFSFTNGVALMYSLVAACSLYGLISSQKLPVKLLSLCGGLATIAAIPLSISRALLLSVVLVCVGGMIAMSLSGKSIRRIVQGLLGLCVLAALASLLPGMERPREAFMLRWVAATDRLGGFQKAIVGRVIEGTTEGVTTSIEGANMLTGVGLGAGTNVGAMLLTGNRVFLVSESEWGRLTGEMGWPLGMAFILFRVALTLWLLVLAWKAARSGDPLALTIWFSQAVVIAQGQWGQPTSLGFAILGGGMVLAAAQHASKGFVKGYARTPSAIDMMPPPFPRKPAFPAPPRSSTPVKGPSGNVW